MTQDEIIEMAKQSDLGFLLGDSWLMHHEIKYFAKLVAKKEREKSEHLLWLFQEWKEDHLSQYNYIEAVEAIRARGQA